MKSLSQLGFLVLLTIASFSPPAFAVIPESGLYWRPNESGLGYYIENQRGRVVFVAYAYEFDGSPSFFTGSGDLREGFGEVLGTGYPYLTGAVGYEPWHYVEMDLYRSSGGACIACVVVQPTSLKVGTASLYFDREASVTMLIALDSGQTTQRQVFRFAYQFAPPAVNSQVHYPLLQDLLGDWVFVDQGDAAAQPLRYSFSVVEQSTSPIDEYTPLPWTVTYSDPTRNAKLICTHERPSGVSPPPSLLLSACQLVQDDQPVLWARLDDIGLNQIVASKGSTLRVLEAYRGDGKVIGLRVK